MKTKKRKYISIILCSLALFLVAVGFSTWIILSEQTGSILPFIIKSDLTSSTPPTVTLTNGTTTVFAGETNDGKSYYTIEDDEVFVFYNKGTTNQRMIEGTWRLETVSSTSTNMEKKTDSTTGTTLYVLSGEGTAKLVFTPTGIYSYLFNEYTTYVDVKNINLYAVAEYNSTYYTTIDGALAAANTAGSGTVHALPSGNYTNIENDRAKIAKTIVSSTEIKQGVTLNIPYSSSLETTNKAVGSKQTGNTYSNPDTYCTNLVTLASPLTVNGNLAIRGQYSSATQGGFAGTPYGLYGKLALEKGKGSLTVNTTVECFGFIDGTDNHGDINFANGSSLMLSFVFYEWRGGTTTLHMVKDFNMTVGNRVGISKMYCAPFYRYTFPNVTGSYTICSGATLLGQANITMNSDITEDVPIIGSTDTSFIQLTTATGKVEVSYDPENSVDAKFGLTEWKIDGGATMHALKIPLAIEELGISISTTVTTADVYLPIPYLLHITLTNGIYNFSGQDAKILPGGKITIGKGANTTVGNLICYDKVYATNDGYIAIPQYPTSATLSQKGYSNKGQLVINNGGTLTAENITGEITSESAGGKLIVNGTNPEGALECLDYYGTAAGTNTKPKKGGYLIITGTLYYTTSPTTTLSLPKYTDASSAFSTTGTYYSMGRNDEKKDEEGNVTSPETFGWVPASYAVTFKANGATHHTTTITSSVGANGNLILTPDSVSAPSNPTPPTYYEFSHWCKNDGCKAGDDCTNKVTFPLAVYGNTTLYAAWKPTVYTVNFQYVYGGFTPAEGSVPSLPKNPNDPDGKFNFTVEDTDIKMPDAPESEYIFNGWYTDAACTAATKITSISGADLLALNNNQTIYGQWVLLQYTFTYENDKNHPTYSNNSYSENLAQHDNVYNPDQINTVTLPQITNTFSSDTSKQYYYDGWLCNGTPVAAGTKLSDLIQKDVLEYKITPNWIQKVHLTVNYGTHGNDVLKFENVDIYIKATDTYTTKNVESGDETYSISKYFNGLVNVSGCDPVLGSDGTYTITPLSDVTEASVTADWADKIVLTINYGENDSGLPTTMKVYLHSSQPSYSITENDRTALTDSNSKRWKFNGFSSIDDSCDISDYTFIPKDGVTEATVTANWIKKVAITLEGVGTVYYEEGDSYTLPSSIDGVTGFINVTAGNDNVKHLGTLNYWTPDNGTTQYKGGVTYTVPENDVTLTPDITYSDPYYKVTISASNSTITITGDLYKADGTASMTSSTATCYAKGDITVQIVAASSYKDPKITIGNTTYSNNSKVTVSQAITINGSATWDPGCLIEGTLITLADGTQKKIEDLSYTDTLLVWNFYDGRYETVPAAAIVYHGYNTYRVLTLQFEDGTTIGVIDKHGFFDANLNKFVFIDESNVEEYLGHEFLKHQDGLSYTAVKLVRYTVTEREIGCYSILSVSYNNCMAEGFFSLTPLPISDNQAFFDCLVIGDNMQYDTAILQENIDKYGLYTYEELQEYMTYEQYVSLNAGYLKIMVEKGVVSIEELIRIIDVYIPK